MSKLNISKIFVSLLFLLASLTFIALQYYDFRELCTTNEILNLMCALNLDDFKGYMFLTALLLLPSFVTFFLESKVFINSIKFAVFSLLLILPFYYYISGIHFGGGIGGAVEAKLWAFLFLCLLGFCLVTSFGIIGVSWWKSRKSN